LKISSAGSLLICRNLYNLLGFLYPNPPTAVFKITRYVRIQLR
jgi:hypothetical protein